MSDFAKSQRHQKLFDEMLVRFDLNARVIGERAGITEVTISRFRNGKCDLGSAKLFAFLAAVPQEARNWYLSELFSTTPESSLRSLIREASPQEKAEILSEIADWLQNMDDLDITKPICS
jgi:transcriptional regulator with XRE-family HTH domain